MESPGTVKELLPYIQLVHGWEACSETDCTVMRMSGAMTNVVYKVRQKLTGQEVILRLQGSEENIFDKQLEAISFQAAAACGLGAQQHAIFAKGRVEECLSLYRTPVAADFREARLSQSVAAALARFHVHMGRQILQIGIPHKDVNRVSGADSKPSVWQRMDRWLAMLHAHQNDGKGLPTALLEHLTAVVPKLQGRLSATQFTTWEVWGHNDAQYGNVMVSIEYNTTSAEAASHEESSQAEGGSSTQAASPQHDVRLIDYDYTCFSTPAFDIGNVWCEQCADYSTSQPHVLDFQHFPSPQQQRAFVRAYLVQYCREHQIKCRGQLQTGDSGAGSGMVLGQDAPRQVPETIATQGQATGGQAAQYAHELRGHSAAMDQVPSRTSAQGSTPGTWEQWLDSRLRGSGDVGSTSVLSSTQMDVLVESLRVSSLAWTAASHLHWALWGWVSAVLSNIDFDFAAYAQQRYEHYQAVAAALGL